MVLIKSKLEIFGKQLDRILGPTFLKKDGMLLKENGDLFNKLVRDLEQALPGGDPGKDPK